MDLKRKAVATDTNKVLPEHKREENLEGCNVWSQCFVLYARSLDICWSQHDCWIRDSFKETCDDEIEVAKLRTVCWLDVRGKFKISDLSPGTVYEVVYVVMLMKGASGWELPIKVISP